MIFNVNSSKWNQTKTFCYFIILIAHLIKKADIIRSAFDKMIWPRVGAVKFETLQWRAVDAQDSHAWPDNIKLFSSANNFFV